MEAVVKIKNQESIGEISKLEAVNEHCLICKGRKDEELAHSQLKKQVDKYHELETH